MKCLVTGCMGFIGSNLCKRLIKEGHEVDGYDNMQTGRVKNYIKRVRLISEGSFLTSLKDYDVIFHLGMPSTSPLYKKDRSNILEAVKSTLRVFEWARERDAVVVYASSSSLYNSHPTPHTEDMVPFNMDWYTETRYFIERIAERYYKAFGTKSIGLRIFSCYGERDKGKKQYANVVTQFALDMMNNRRPLIYGDGEQSRDFTHVDDVAKAFVESAKALESGKCECGIINVGTGTSWSFKESVAMINGVLGTNIKPQYTENQIHNYVFDTRADTRKMEKFLGFKGKPFIDVFPKYIKGLRDVEDTG